MKRIVVFVATIVSAIALVSCDLFTEYITQTQSVETVEASGTKSWNYTTNNNVFEVDSSTLSVTINGSLGGKTLYYATVNPSSYAIGYNGLRKITSSDLVSSSPSGVPSRPFSLSAETTSFSEQNGRTHFVGESLPVFTPKNVRAARATTSSSVVQNYALNAKKDIFVDNNASMNAYKAKSATLYAKGTYCYVWIVDDYYNATASGNKVNTAIAQKYATAFDNMYKIITNVFGEESEEIADYDADDYVPIASISDTGSMINIVVYDIGVDYMSEDNPSSGGVVGYFYAKDYYHSTAKTNSVIDYSNVGKYFYIDSGFANSNFNDTISTLAHEFQHMVNYNMKSIRLELNPDTSYNEMLSMLCEDMMQNSLNLEDSESPKNRSQNFNGYYFYSGIREYRNDNYAALSYSTSYLFGAWLCRRYGGAALVKEIMHNDYIDNDSFVAAVNTLNSTHYTFDDLFKQFIQELFGVTTWLNQNAKTTLSYTSGYSYPMTGFNIFEDTYSPAQIDKYQSSFGNGAYEHYNYAGPFIFDNAVYKIDLRADYGIHLHGVGTYASGKTSDTITFSTKGADKLKMYLIIK